MSSHFFIFQPARAIILAGNGQEAVKGQGDGQWDNQPQNYALKRLIRTSAQVKGAPEKHGRSL